MTLLKKESPVPPIAVVGMGTMFPGRGTTVGYWRDIVEGTDASSEIPGTHWLPSDFYDADPSKPDKTYANRGAFIPSFPFDPVEFGIPPNVIETTDTVQLISLYIAKQVLAQASLNKFNDIDREKTSVIIGVAAGTELIGDMASRLNQPMWLRAMQEAGIEADKSQEIAARISSHYTEWRESTFPGLLGNVVAGRICNRLDLNGTNFTADAACASSLAAMKHAVHELWLGESDLVIAGGSDALNNIFMYMCFSKTPAMSPTGLCRPFAEDADGTLLGEGCGLFALRRLEDAERDGNTIYAVLTGMGASSDGKATSVYAPRSGGQALAINRALDAANISARTVELVEAHGTGTRAGDAAEFGGLKQVFEPTAPGDKNWCAVGSVKSQIGHTKSAAGAASLAKIISSLHQATLPPTLHADKPNPKMDIGNSPFYLNTKTRPWIRGADHPRRAGVSSFGFGGSNFHTIVEEYKGPGKIAPRLRTAPTELFLFSANSAENLFAKAKSLCEEIRQDSNLPHFAQVSQKDFDAKQPFRLSIVTKDLKHFASQLEKTAKMASQQASFSMPDICYQSSPASIGKIAFLFSGQGSQYVGMGSDLACSFDAARQIWDWTADQDDLADKALHQIVFPVPALDKQSEQNQINLLKQTQNAQPAIGAVSLSQLAVLKSLKLQPDCVAGHSFGEVMALHAAGVFDDKSALHLARARGMAMAEAAKNAEGKMLSVKLDRASIAQWLSTSDIDVVIANDNSENQVVLSGSSVEIDKAQASLEGRQVACTLLPVDTAFHSPLVANAALTFGAHLNSLNFESPRIDVYSNTSGKRHENDVSVIKAQLGEQLAKPVHFRSMIEQMYADGVRTFIEVGPGNVITGLVETILQAREHLAISIDNKRTHGWSALHQALSKLAINDVAVDLDALWQHAPAPAPLAEPRKHAIYLNGANHNKPYPPKNAEVIPPQADTRIELAALPANPVVSTPTVAAARPNQQQLSATANSRVAMQTDNTSSGASVTTDFLDESKAAPQPIDELPDSILQIMHGEIKSTAIQQMELRTETVPTPAAAVTPETDATDTMAPLVLEIVSEKTGYPQDMLDMNMDLEAELGIDSIKQVEILSALRERMPDMPEIDPARLAELRTLAQIAEAIGGAAPQQSTPPSGLNGAAPHPAPEPVAAAVTPQEDVTAAAHPIATPAAAQVDTMAPLVLEIVAEKTGYPQDMLDMNMDLEAELGIDSIKQVEILSALRERMPDMPEIDPARLAELRTLAQIAEAIGGAAPQQSTSPSGLNGVAPHPASEPVAAAVMPQEDVTVTAAAQPIAASVATPAAAQVDTMAPLVLEIVAEKTGYPQDMLDMNMDLEAELGIDSIKQVEILSALRERMPDMPEIDPARLAELRTLAQIAEAIGGAAPQQSTPPPGLNGAAPHPASEPVAAAVTPQEDVTVTAAAQPVAASVATPAAAQVDTMAPLVLEIVAEKTGYPQDMLDMNMDLEAELGIDSIKQVEILSALRERMPDMPEIDPARLAELRTLAQIAEAIGGAAPQQTTPPSGLNGAAPHPAPEPVAAAVMPQEDVTVTAAAQPIAMPIAAPVATPAVAQVDTMAPLVLEIVAEKTGYPQDMLDMNMDLEAELGIDSIKQVEILSALRERMPDMPEIDPARLAELRTLAQIAEAIGGAAPQQSASPSGLNGAAPHPASEPVAAAVTPQEDVTVTAAAQPIAMPIAAPVATPAVAQVDTMAPLVLEIVAEKTGYPQDMLDMNMDLEAELGIDSIKQVEILSALRERMPDMPEIDPARLAELRTLAQIAEAIGGAAPQQSTPPPGLNGVAPHPAPEPIAAAVMPQEDVTVTAAAQPIAASVATPAAAQVDTMAPLVLEIVAEKTGYPQDMLDMNMDLEAELGIDSIKQVEILSALRERMPDMPEIDPARLAELRTLAQIAEAIGGREVSVQAEAEVATTQPTLVQLDETTPARAGQMGLFRQEVELQQVVADHSAARWLQSSDTIYVTNEAPDVANALAEKLTEGGLAATCCSTVTPQARIVISTAGLQLDASSLQVHLNALRTARTIADVFQREGGVFITLHDTGGRLGRHLHDIEAAARGGLTGLAKTAALEWPKAHVKAIDIALSEAGLELAVQAIADELLFGGSETEVGLLADGTRLVPKSRQVAQSTQNISNLRDGMTIVVSGGGRGITASIITNLAQVAKLNFVLLGRTQLIDWPADIDADISDTALVGALADKARNTPQASSLAELRAASSQLLASRDIAKTIAAIEAAGSNVLYYAVDITNSEQVENVISQVRKNWGSINGLIHGAGVLADKLIKDKADQQFERVFKTKVDGLMALLSATDADELEFVNLFSSIAGRYGNTGQSDYAMANEVLNRMAWSLKNLMPKCKVSSINWGPWEGGMVDDAVRAKFQSMGIPLIPEAIGVDAFLRECLRGSGSNPEIVFAGTGRIETSTPSTNG